LRGVCYMLKGNGPRSKPEILNVITKGLDGYIVPFSFGICSVLVLAQFLMTNPTIMHRVDMVSGRMIIVPADNVPAAITSQSAQITLYLSPAVSRPDVQVYINQQLVTNFLKPKLQITVHDGDKVTIVSSTVAGEEYISVDHNDSMLLLPAPGQTFELSPSSPQVSLPIVKFL